jgi:hypothetical protein
MRLWSIALGVAPLFLQIRAGAPDSSSPAEPPPVAEASARPPASPSPPPPEIIRPIPELARLQFAAGAWVPEKEVDHGGEVGVPKLGSGRSKVSWRLKGHHLHVLYKSKRSGLEYEGRGVVSWDAEARRYRVEWFDNLGRALHFLGDFNPAEVLVFSTDYSRDGKPLKQNISIKKERNGKVLILDERVIGSEAKALYMESLAAPVAPAPKATSVPSGSPPTTTEPTTSP